MSIINDALKKTQEELAQANTSQENTAGASAPKDTAPPSFAAPSFSYPTLAPTQLPPAPPVKKSEAKNTPKISTAQRLLRLAVLLIAFCVILYCALPYLPKSLPLSEFFSEQGQLRLLNSLKAKITAMIPAQSPKTGNRPAKQAAQKSKAPGGELVLNGIIAADKEPLALINNQIYKAGDLVEGKKIIAIFVDKVEIEDNEKILTLRIQ